MSEGGETYEDFWGCTLTKGKNEVEWAPLETEDDIEHKLQLTSACLGVKAKDGERNLVEVTTENDNGDEVVCSIVSLRAGGSECMHLELGFNNPTKFRLREGSGPLSLCGTHLKAAPLDMLDDEDFSDEEDDEDIPNLVEPKKALAPKPVIEKKTAPAPTKAEKKTEDKPGKRPLEDKKDKQAPSKKKKVEPEPEPEESEDEESEDEEEGELESGEDEEGSDDEEMPSLLDGEAVEDDDEDSEDEDEPEGDDVDSDEEEGSESDEEDEEEEESEEEEEKTPAKKPLTNGHAKKTPAKKEEKTPAKTPSKSAGAKKGMDEIKSLLLKSPNLPKKFDKFANYMKNNMKVTDKKTQQEVWDFVQKNRK